MVFSLKLPRSTPQPFVRPCVPDPSACPPVRARPVLNPAMCVPRLSARPPVRSHPVRLSARAFPAAPCPRHVRCLTLPLVRLCVLYLALPCH